MTLQEAKEAQKPIARPHWKRNGAGETSWICWSGKYFTFASPPGSIRHLSKEDEVATDWFCKGSVLERQDLVTFVRTRTLAKLKYAEIAKELNDNKLTCRGVKIDEKGLSSFMISEGVRKKGRSLPPPTVTPALDSVEALKDALDLLSSLDLKHEIGNVVLMKRFYTVISRGLDVLEKSHQ